MTSDQANQIISMLNSTNILITISICFLLIALVFGRSKL